ncbi:MAG: hypothetical protein ACF8PN_02590 [Phycisphaerales bacterium]
MSMCFRNLLAMVGVAVATGHGVGPRVDAEPPSYAILQVGDLLDGYGRPTAVNDLGVIAGEMFGPGANSSDAFLQYRNAVRSLLPPIGCVEAAGTDINDLNVVVGHARQGQDRVAVIWDADGSPSKLPGLGGGSETATAVNNIGDIVGRARLPLPDDGQAPVIWINGHVFEMPRLADEYSHPAAINDRRIAVGYHDRPNGTRRAIAWSSLRAFDLGTLGGNRAEAHDINNLDEIVGWAAASPGDHRAVVWRHGGANVLGAGPYRVPREAFAINDLSEIVGLANTGGIREWLLWTKGEVYGFEEILPPNSTWEFHADAYATVYDINDLSQIIGRTTRGDSESSEFLMTPVRIIFQLEILGNLAGQHNILRVVNAQPDSRIDFVWALEGGGTILPNCDLSDAALQLDEAQHIGSLITDHNGVGELTIFVPDEASSMGEILFQAVDSGACELSPIVVTEFQ